MRRGEEHQMLHDLSDIYEKGGLTDWEQTFIEAISDQLDRGAILTDKQRKKLADIYEEKVTRQPMALMTDFRAADLSRVTNGYLIRQGFVPCETNPDTGGLSRTTDPAHALAVFTITGKGFESRHVCRECALTFYTHRPIKEGVIWS